MAHRSYLLLGEGDFTYSLDFCRYLASLPAGGVAPASVTCTGVDSLDELRAKYRDVDFTLRGIRRCRAAGGDGRALVDATVLHGVNAVRADVGGGGGWGDAPDTAAAATNEPFDHVLFHHPHLGTEDARLHSRFLRHLFHAADRRWMRPGTGLLHLTLVDGQCARWGCLAGAARHGLALLRRRPFRPPPPPMEGAKGGGGGKTYYALRRHQSGKSFANRRRMQGEEAKDVPNQSETLVFGRACDYSVDGSRVNFADVGLLPWETANGFDNPAKAQRNADEATTLVSTSQTSHVDENSDPYPCPHCSKSFREHRSLKNHMMCSHPDCQEVLAWKSEKKKKKGKKRKLPKGDGETKCLAVGKDGSLSTRQSNANAENGEASTRCSVGDDAGGPPWICRICEARDETSGAPRDRPRRAFPHRQALLDHQRAKHFGAHADIKPDWYRSATAADGEVARRRDVDPADAPAAEKCPICDMPYASEADRLRHEAEFVPSAIAKFDSRSATPGDDRSAGYRCGFCSKAFRDTRARRQHENFCRARVRGTGGAFDAKPPAPASLLESQTEQQQVAM